MRKCKEVSTDIATGRLETASWRDRLACWMHLLLCPHCRRYRDQIEEMGAAARELGVEGAEGGGSGTLEGLKQAILRDVEE
jgi:hypothetical protein